VDCATCGAVWEQRSARFCGRCGALLGPSATSPRDRAGRPGHPRARQLTVVVIATLVAIGVVAVGAGIGSLGDVEPSAAPPSFDVDLPEEVAGEPPPPGDERPDRVEQGDRGLRCSPEPCERWRAELPPGVTVVDDAVYHLGQTEWRLELTALALEDGTVLWSEPIVVPDATNGAPLSDHQPQRILTALEEVVLVAAGGHLQARSRIDGRLVWEFEREGWLPYSISVGPAGTALLASSLEANMRGEDQGPPWEAVAALDIDSGTIRWEREITSTLWGEPDPGGPWLVLEVDDGAVTAPSEAEDDPETEEQAIQDRRRDRLVALDPVTGEDRWHRDLPEDGFQVTPSTIQVRNGAWLEHWDAETGEVISRLEMAEGPGDAASVEMFGQLLVRRSESDMPTDEGSHRWLQQVDVVDARDGREILSTSGIDWVPIVPLPAGGIVLFSGSEEIMTATALDADGGLAWERELGLPNPEWPRWPDVADDGVLVLLTASEVGSSDVAVRQVDPSSGDDLDVFGIDVQADAFDWGSLETRWPMVIQHGPSGVRFHGPAGAMELQGDVWSLTTDPLIVATSRGLVVRLDERLLLGDG
jgi:outer membrane protein assembly factor BamB